MTIKLRNSSSSSTLLSSSHENDPIVERKFCPTHKLWCSSDEDDEATLSKKTRISSRDSCEDSSINPRVVSTSSSSSSSSFSAPNVVEPDQPTPLTYGAPSGVVSEGLKRHHSRNSSQDNSDCDSVSSANSSGTISVTSRKSKRQHAMSVRFAEPLVTKIFTRPKTLPEDKYLLHYSFDEMDEFREDYYRFCEEQEEQMLLDQLANSSPSEESLLLDGYPTDCSVFSDSSSSSETHLIDDENEECEPQQENIKSQPPSKHSISKVMVLHSDVTIFCASKPHGVELTKLNKDSKIPLVYTASNDDNDYSFDNPAFWNGSLTWY